MYTKGEWKAGYNPSVTGPTTPVFPSPICGGRDWPYRTINVGQDTIAIVPAQTLDRQIGKQGKPIPNSAEANANLIASAVNACIKLNPDNPMAVAESMSDMYEALISASGSLKLYDPGSPVIDEIDKALAKAGGGKNEYPKA